MKGKRRWRLSREKRLIIWRMERYDAFYNSLFIRDWKEEVYLKEETFPETVHVR